jgi:3-dehydroquinate dehydratase-2
MSRKVLLLNGPNLNLLGTRETEVYGTTTLDDIVEGLRAHGSTVGIEIEDFQSNIEGELIDRLHVARTTVNGVVFNPGAFTHYSYALRDAISATELPVIETHLSNVHAREEFRHRTVLAAVCLGVVAGFGPNSYRVAFDALVHHFDAS